MEHFLTRRPIFSLAYCATLAYLGGTSLGILMRTCNQSTSLAKPNASMWRG